ncbi:hypothetical protein LIER_31285 [Lithospermum erythrorhizon]|uniref:Uncharacterized protein n=1 Tax=Lithospermum erythrorhizon TaxID=34254 RepID=A0AAV3RUH0_LITER
MKDSTPLGGDVLETTVDDLGKDPVVEGMDVDLPTAIDTEPETTKVVVEGVLPRVPDTAAETTETMERPLSEEARVMPTVATANPFYLKLVLEFICNMTEDIDDIAGPNHHKVGVANMIPTTHSTSAFESLGRILYMISTGASFDLGRVLFDQTIEHAQSNAVLKPIAYPSIICSILLVQNEDILTADDNEDPPPGVITISPKLMEGTHVADVPLGPTADERASGSKIDATAKMLRDEIKYLDGVMQSTIARKSVLEARLRSLDGEDDPDADTVVGDSGAKAPQT